MIKPVFSKNILTSATMAFFITLFSVYEKSNNTVVSMSDINMSLIIEFEFTFGQTFLSLLPILFVNYFVQHKVKYLIYSMILVIFTTYIFSTLPETPYTYVQTIVGAIIHTSFMTAAFIAIFLFFDINTRKPLFFAVTTAAFVCGVVISYIAGLKQQQLLETYKAKEQINIEIGRVLERIQNYKIVQNILANNDINTTSKIQRYQEKFLQLDIDLISADPRFRNKLLDNNYCAKFKDLNTSLFKNTENISKACNP